MTGYISPGVGQAGQTLRQRGLHTLTLHLLHPVAFLTDQCPQPENMEEQRGKDEGSFSRWEPLKQQLVLLPGGGIGYL